MPTFVQLLVALAVTGLLAGFERPGLLIAGAVAGVWPDFLAWILTPLMPGPDLQISPDPDHPDPATLTTGLDVAARSVRHDGQARRVRLNPVPARGVSCAHYELDLERFRTAAVRLAGRAAAFEWRDWLPRHALPLRVADEAVDLALTPLADGRIASDIAPVIHPAGHTWLWLPALAAAAVVWPEPAIVATAVMALHLALDYGGHANLAPLWPVSPRVAGGLGTWDGSRRETAFGLGGLAVLSLIVSLLAGARIPWIAERPLRAWVLGALALAAAAAAARRIARVSTGRRNRADAESRSSSSSSSPP